MSVERVVCVRVSEESEGVCVSVERGVSEGVSER